MSGNSKKVSLIIDYLRNKGIDVVEYRKLSSNDSQVSIVIDRNNQKEKAYNVASILGISSNRVYQKVEKRLLVDCTLVIGNDVNSIISSIKIK